MHFKNAKQDQLCQVGRILQLTKNLLVEFITKPVCFHLFLFQKLILMDLFIKAEGDVHTRKKVEKGD